MGGKVSQFGSHLHFPSSSSCVGRIPGWNTPGFAWPNQFPTFLWASVYPFVTMEWEPFALTRRADAMSGGRALAILAGRSLGRLQHIWAGHSRSNLQGWVNEER